MTIKIIESEAARKLSAKEKWEMLGPYLQEHGRGCLAYSTLQDLNYFIDENRGYIAYSPFKHPILSRNGKKYVLADPITARSDYQNIIESFLSKNPDSVFIQVSRDAAEVLDATGFEVNQLGIETEIDLNDFSTKGPARSKLRQWQNKCRRERVAVEERDIAEVDLTAVKNISKKWIKRKGGHEFSMLTRPLVYGHEQDVRYFWAKQDGKTIAMSIYDPIYEKQKIVGYYHNFDRIVQKSPNGTGSHCVLEAINKFKDEGVQFVSLGMSPLSRIDDDLNHNALLAWCARILYAHGNFIYPFKGNESHKDKYNGSKKKIYFSSSKGNDLFEVLSLLTALKLF
jgi:phosphatidylglycerol lysyltransferase